MSRSRLPVVVLVLLGCTFCFAILGGCGKAAAGANQLDQAPLPPNTNYAAATPTPWTSPRPTAPAVVHLAGPLTVGVSTALPEEFTAPLLLALSRLDELETDNGIYPVRVLDQAANAGATIELAPLRDAETPLAERFYAVAAPFATVTDDISLEELQARWQGQAEGAIFASATTATMLAPILGDYAGPTVDPAELHTRIDAAPGSLAILPFDDLDPTYKTLTVDGVNLLDNHLDPATYPLAVALDVRGKGAPLLIDALRPAVAATNRDPEALTTLIMTGVTAIARGTAAAIERNYLTYPAAIISDTLAAADITHISNEIPFLSDCVVNNTENNLILCSHTDYWAILEAVGTDIVGLSGNHVNDFGREGARESLTFYHDHDIPIYGSGFNIEEACAPLMWEHNGNTFAFIAALAFEPVSARATEDEPGACYYYDNRDAILAKIKELAATVDIVAVELQYEESYDAAPLPGQVDEFRALREAGADLVTGVQSHVPQAMEPYRQDDPGGPGIILYGLGNLFFDQMWSWETRTELMARNTIYEGRLLNTEILTAVLEDFAQPRWATADERAEILTRIFNAAPPPPQPDAPDTE